MIVNDYLKQNFNISDEVLNLCIDAEKELSAEFLEAEEISALNQYKVLQAMQKNKVSDMHFAQTTGYGYNDIGRDTLESVYADIFKAEAALVRPQLISGTHALTVAMFGNLRPNDEIFSPVGVPYDTLQGVIGIRKERGSFDEYGITYKQTDLLPDGTFDFEGIKNNINKNTKLVIIQRSKGYTLRKTLSVLEIKELISYIKTIKDDVIFMVDNCYGEFVLPIEPIEVGADLAVGSLIKNPGGGLCPVGGYIVGKEEYVLNAAARLTSPGLMKEVGPSLGVIPSFFQGIFLSPQVVLGCVKGAYLSSKVFSKLGFSVYPKPHEKRSDIVQAISLNSEEKVIAFCQGIQKAAPVDSFVVPEPWAMPGYDAPVIMAAGAFIQGSSIELSADAPIKEPFNVFVQGGLTYNHSKIGTMIALQTMLDKNLLKI